MYQAQIERQSQCGEGSSEQSTKKSDDNIFLEVVGGINKKGRIFGLGSQAATVRASMKDSIPTDAASSEEVAMLKDKVQALTTELQQLQQKNLEQESIKEKVDRYERMFERLMVDKNLKALLVEPEGEADNYNAEMGEDEMDGDSV